DSPAQQLANIKVVGSLDDVSGLEDIARISNLLTLENEFVNAPLLEHIESLGVTIYPTARTVGLIQDKLFQKRSLQSNAIDVPRFIEVSSPKEIVDAGKGFGWPLILKARRNGYDGRGNELITGPDETRESWSKLDGEKRSLMVEAFIRFKKELAVMVARTPNGDTVTYPVVETVHKNHICHVVKAPADIDEAVGEIAAATARRAVETLDGVGIFGVEMFLLDDDRVLINEIAPRPHNSGHYTIEACVTSQFENHLRAILGLPLGSASMVSPAAAMVNLLAEQSGVCNTSGVENALEIPGVNLHLYGKKTTRPSRKMGHITVLGGTVDEALEKAVRAAGYISF
ncbi:MAG: 5-(carboxyamino)imidazole ribonucleotide synthase, partial [Thermodesulfobacteriota bacterium]